MNEESSSKIDSGKALSGIPPPWPTMLKERCPMLFLHYGELEVINGAFVLIQDAIKWQIAKLKTQGRIRRIGPDKGGHWEVTAGKYKKSSESGLSGLKDEPDQKEE